MGLTIQAANGRVWVMKYPQTKEVSFGKNIYKVLSKPLLKAREGQQY